MRKIVLLLVIFNALFATVARAENKTNSDREQQLIVENTSYFILGKNERSPYDYYLKQANNYAEQEKWELALTNYNKAIKINPNSAEAYFGRGEVYEEQKKWKLALADYDRAIEINPKYAEAYLNRSTVYTEEKKWELALADLNKVIEMMLEYVER